MVLAAFADEAVDFGHFDAQAVAGQIFKTFVFGGWVGEPFGNHGVEGDGADGQAVPFKNNGVVFGVVGYFGDGGVGHGRANGLDDGGQGELVVGEDGFGGEEGHLAAGGLGRAGEVADGHVVGDGRFDGQADADDFGLHFVQAGGFEVEADEFGLVEGGD